MPRRNAERYLIVNADDFGLSSDINRGIILAHEQGIVTSASLMVRGGALEEAVSYASRHPNLDLGLHVDLGEWYCRAGEWEPLYEVVAADDRLAVHYEVARQVKLFCDLCGRPPTHIDSHQHVHRNEPAREAVLVAATAFGVPVRHFTSAIRYCGDFYGQTAEGLPVPGAVSVRALLGIIERLEPGATELACHPGLDMSLETMYREERAIEVATLCDPRVRDALSARGVHLARFSKLTAGHPGTLAG